MPTASLVIDPSPIAELVRRLEAVDGDRREAMEAIGAAWETTTRNRFETSTAPDGTPWKPSQRVLAHKGKTPLKTLVESARLKGSITHQVDGDTVEVGTNVEYAAAHQFGATIQQAGAHAVPLVLPEGATGGRVIVLPARPFLGIEEGDYLNFAEILEGLIEAKTGAAP